MDEAQEILLSSLENSGITLPAGVSPTRDLNDCANLVSLCAQSLNLIGTAATPFPTSLPDAMADRLKLCTDIASAVKSAGYRGDLSFHQLLYPSTEDSHKLVRFLVEKLSELTVAKHVSDKLLSSNVEVDDSTCGRELPKKSTKPQGFLFMISSSEDQNYDEAAADLEQKLASLREKSSKIRDGIVVLRDRESVLREEAEMKNLEVKKLEDELWVLKAATEIPCDDEHPAGSYSEELNKKREIKQKILASELQRDGSACLPRVEKTHGYQEPKGQSIDENAPFDQDFVNQSFPALQEKLSQLKGVELEAESIISEIQKREEELAIFRSEISRLPKLPSRKSYIQRIIEITKNSRKQDADIECIVRDTRELQKESNSIQERLHRTYSVADDTTFRGLKDDPVRRQVYQLLTSIHDSFQQISETIRATDRARRESADKEAKLAILTTRSFDIGKLQADLDAIRKENEILEHQLQDSSSQGQSLPILGSHSSQIDLR